MILCVFLSNDKVTKNCDISDLHCINRLSVTYVPDKQVQTEPFHYSHTLFPIAISIASPYMYKETENNFFLSIIQGNFRCNELFKLIHGLYISYRAGSIGGSIPNTFDFDSNLGEATFSKLPTSSNEGLKRSVGRKSMNPNVLSHWTLEWTEKISINKNWNDLVFRARDWGSARRKASKHACMKVYSIKFWFQEAVDEIKNVVHVSMMTAKSKSWLASLKPLENLYFSM